MQVTTSSGLVPPQSTTVGRKVAKGRKTHFTGQLAMECGGVEKLMDVESHTEMMIALVLRARRTVVDIENQVPFVYKDGYGTSRTHNFDFRVSLRDGTRIAIFVKHSKYAARGEGPAKRRLIASQVTSDFADRVVLMTEKDLDPIETHNAELLHEVRVSEPEVDAIARRVVRTITGDVRVRDLVDAIGRDGQGFRAVARLVGTGELDLVNHERISPDALVRRRAN